MLRYRSLASVELFRRKHGLWRSLVAHYTGGVGVAGSNPVSPTTEKPGQPAFSPSTASRRVIHV